MNWTARKLFARQVFLFLIYLVLFLYIATPNGEDIVSNEKYDFATNIAKHLTGPFETIGYDMGDTYDFLESNLPMFRQEEYGDAHVLGAGDFFLEFRRYFVPFYLILGSCSLHHPLPRPVSVAQFD